MRKVEIALSLLAGAFVFYMAVLSVIEDEAHAEVPEVSSGEHMCWDYHQEVMERLRATESPYVMPCVNCVLDRSTTPYCDNLCGPTPYEGLSEILDETEAP